MSSPDSNQSIVPEWASFFTPLQYETFILELNRYFAGKGLTPTLEGSLVLVNGGAFGSQQLGLTNVAQVCKQGEIDNYGELISAHFDSMERGESFRKEFEEKLGNFDAIKSYIAVRLYPQHYMERLPKDSFMGRELPGSMYAMLVFDQPDTITNIKPSQASGWMKTDGELFQLAVENTRANNPISVSPFSFEDFSVFFAEADHFFVPNILFDLDARAGLTGLHGALIGLPHRHAALIYPIHDLNVIQAINGLIPTIHGMYREGPGSLSPCLFWYHNGDLIELPYTISDDSLTFSPPVAFVEMLNQLAENPASPDACP